jgi:hypothetical protein
LVKNEIPVNQREKSLAKHQNGITDQKNFSSPSEKSTSRCENSIMKWAHNKKRSRKVQKINISESGHFKRTKNGILNRTRNIKRIKSRQLIVNHVRKEKNRNNNSRTSVSSYHKERFSTFGNGTKREEGKYLRVLFVSN